MRDGIILSDPRNGVVLSDDQSPAPLHLEQDRVGTLSLLQPHLLESSFRHDFNTRPPCCFAAIAAHVYLMTQTFVGFRIIS